MNRFQSWKRCYWATIIVLGVLCGAIVWHVAWPRGRTRWPSTGTKTVIDPDATVQSDVGKYPITISELRMLDAQGRWALRLGALEIGSQPLGFLRLGAFNEAILSDLSIAIAPDIETDRSINMLRNLVTDILSLARAPISTVKPREPTSAAPTFLSERLRVFSPDIPSRISSIRIRNFSLSIMAPDANDFPLLRAASGKPTGSKAEPALLLEKNIVIGNQGEIWIECRTANLSLGDRALVTARRGVLYTSTTTQSFESISFPLEALMNGDDLSGYIPLPPTATAY